MHVRSLLVGLVALTVSVPVALLSACSDDTGTGGGGGDPLADVQYEGGATDEALEALLAATPKDEPARAPVFDFPTDGAEIPGASAPIIKWHAGGATASRSIERFLEAPPSDRTTRGVMDVMLGVALSGVRPAYAHGTPLTGPGFLLTIEAGEERLARVFTKGTEYLPNDATWASMKGAAQPLTLRLLAAEFETNRIAPDGGPWQGADVTVTITP